jgi:hypothetical protein
VRVERAASLRIGDGPSAATVPLTLDAEHEAQLTRDDTTSAVHYLHAAFTAELVERFATEPVALVIDHPEYRHEATLGADTVAELLNDLRG